LFEKDDTEEKEATGAAVFEDEDYSDKNKNF
jgi:hypothetical protein